ncbi:NAD(P)-dependent dehydrogenase (short-subunit alcohol dehydrogenase family) [Sphingopyxis italica]|uniref:NAD(P)-dependent dehydrogenase (Short-subunit alcohol dehydrogenase family) n=1 Tax=Sphingopyxis italica TaxID=1129133 RepID=A0A7X5XS63_9SPHN|nr:SDR family oxidoreductase [Sphingopyxis italica]NJB89999.1 NAD(P)-dependent dehydrogenase (short-subunit alcohol dehydrogenase family) [Sphingopyxis italica]
MAKTPESEQRRWVVTGASRGLGLAIARLAASKGDKVALVARGKDIDAQAKTIGENAIGLVADVTDPASVTRACAEVAERWGGIDVLVNNAGLHRGGLIGSLALDDWQAVLDTNLSGPLNFVRAALPYLGEGGAVVNIGAIVGLRGFSGDAAYGASKAGLAGLTQVLAVELARRGIRVNLVIPGMTSTEMTAGISARAKAKLVAAIPLGREGTAEELADVVWWVAGSPYMTGSIISNDGGLLCRL